jgi:hypothetical protein
MGNMLWSAIEIKPVLQGVDSGAQQQAIFRGRLFRDNGGNLRRPGQGPDQLGCFGNAMGPVF